MYWIILTDLSMVLGLSRKQLRINQQKTFASSFSCFWVSAWFHCAVCPFNDGVHVVCIEGTIRDLLFELQYCAMSAIRVHRSICVKWSTSSLPHSTKAQNNVNFRTLSETLMASGLLAWLILFGIPAIKLDEIIYCETHGFHYECAGHPQVNPLIIYQTIS